MGPAEIRPEEILGVAQLGCPSTWQEDHKIQCRQEATEMLPATPELVNLTPACIDDYGMKTTSRPGWGFQPHHNRLCGLSPSVIEVLGLHFSFET